MNKRVDSQGARSIAEVEQKYGRKFSEVYNVSAAAARRAQEANRKLDSLDQDQIFKLLTDNGEKEGAFYEEDGTLYINASYIRTGRFSVVKEVFIEPDIDVLTRIDNHIRGAAIIPEDQIPLYDFNGDGVVTSADAQLAKKAAEGIESLASWSGAKASKVEAIIDFFDTANTIRFTGVDMWGKSFDRSIGIKSAFLDVESNGCMYRMDGNEKEWLNPSLTIGEEYRTAERYNGQVVYKKVIEVMFDEAGTKTVTTSIDYSKRMIVGFNYTYTDSYTVYASHPNVSVSLTPYITSYNLTVTAPSYGACYVEIKYI